MGVYHQNAVAGGQGAAATVVDDAQVRLAAGRAAVDNQFVTGRVVAAQVGVQADRSALSDIVARGDGLVDPARRRGERDHSAVAQAGERGIASVGP